MRGRDQRFLLFDKVLILKKIVLVRVHGGGMGMLGLGAFLPRPKIHEKLLTFVHVASSFLHGIRTNNL